MPPPSSSAFDDSPVTVVRAVLTSAEVRAVHAAASVLEAIQTPLGYDSTLRPAEEMPFGLQPPPTSLFLHADGCLARECPDIFRKIVEVARRCADTVTREPSQHLGVRTIEFHTCRWQAMKHGLFRSSDMLRSRAVPAALLSTSLESDSRPGRPSVGRPARSAALRHGLGSHDEPAAV